MAYTFVLQVYMTTDDGVLPPPAELGQLVADAITAKIPHLCYFVAAPPPAAIPPAAPWYVERRPDLATVDYYRQPNDAEPYRQVATTWTMRVLEISDAPHNRLLVFNKNGVTIWIPQDQIQTAATPAD